MPEIVDNAQVIQGVGYPKIFGILNPRPLAKKRPYTYGLLKQECLDAICIPDTVRVRVYEPKHDYGKEVWFDVLSAMRDYIEGRIASGVVLKFPKWVVTEVNFADPDNQPLAELPQKKDRSYCLIDTAIRALDCKVQHVFREEPKILYVSEPNYFADSGWRLSSDSTPLWDVQAEFVPLCDALDCDDSVKLTSTR